MKRLVIVLCVLLCAGFTLSAAASVKADDIALGAISANTDFGGVSLVLGSGSAEVTAAGSNDAGYANVLTLSGDAALSFQASAGEMISIIGAVPSGDEPFEVMISSDAGAEVAGGEAADGGVMLVEHPAGNDGMYMVCSAYGNPVSIYQVTVE